jgi:F0F1-type ATP synthase assembly protein I
MRGEGSPYKVLRAFALGSTLAFQFAVSVVLGILGGRYLDQVWGTAPWMMFLGLLLGLAAGTMAIYRTASSFLPKEQADKESDRRGGV